MPSEAVVVRVDGAVATVLMDRADHGNALTRSMIEELRQALSDLHLEKRVRAVILSGAGEAFCLGRDLSEMAAESGEPEDLQRWGLEADEYRQLLVDMLDFPKPLIAAVNGPALAGGAGLVLGCDLVVAGQGATLGFPEPRYGLIAGVAAPLLAFRAGAGVAARLLVGCEELNSEESQRIGLFHEVIADDLVWARAHELGVSCAACAPQAIGLTKRLLYETIGEDLSTQLSSGAIASATARTTDSAKEGLAAQQEEREPEWP